jgi:hypothetical protein
VLDWERGLRCWGSRCGTLALENLPGSKYVCCNFLEMVPALFLVEKWRSGEVERGEGKVMGVRGGYQSWCGDNCVLPYHFDCRRFHTVLLFYLFLETTTPRERVGHIIFIFRSINDTHLLLFFPLQLLCLPLPLPLLLPRLVLVLSSSLNMFSRRR